MNGLSRALFGPPVLNPQPFPIVSLVRQSITSAVSDREARCWHTESSFYTLFDIDKGLFSPLVKAKNRKILCLLCRGHRSRRGTCEHENSWELQSSTRHSQSPPIFDPNEHVFEEEHEIGQMLDNQDDHRTFRFRTTKVKMPRNYKVLPKGHENTFATM